MIDAAIVGGVRHFYPSEFGGDISYGENGKKRYFRDKVATREHLRDRAREVPGFAYTLLMTGGFTEFTAHAVSGVDLEKHTAATYGTPDAQITITAIPECVDYFLVASEEMLIRVYHQRHAIHCPVSPPPFGAGAVGSRAARRGRDLDMGGAHEDP
jgi:hypothetical protein